ncbi:MAG: polyphosphate polymerase domain-containing protein [Myxococcales bacterium]|nr:polyphosphate polymerase domain-containing protein [Myxococcales bacterium]
MSEGHVASLLGALRPSYAVLLSSDAPMATYRTLYFDTLDYRCYHDHRRGLRPRFKVRIRHYDDRELSFLEVKTKRGPSVTSKVRAPRVFCNDELSADDREFLAKNTPVARDDLHPTLWTNFSRLTLLSLDGPERVTIDCGLNFVSGKQAVAMTGVAIVEVKQASYCLRTKVMRELRKRRIRPASASKYCAALHATRNPRPNNRLLPSLRAMEDLRV